MVSLVHVESVFIFLNFSDLLFPSALKILEKSIFFRFVANSNSKIHFSVKNHYQLDSATFQLQLNFIRNEHAHFSLARQYKPLSVPSVPYQMNDFTRLQ